MGKFGPSHDVCPVRLLPATFQALGPGPGLTADPGSSPSFVLPLSMRAKVGLFAPPNFHLSGLNILYHKHLRQLDLASFDIFQGSGTAGFPGLTLVVPSPRVQTPSPLARVSFPEPDTCHPNCQRDAQNSPPYLAYRMGSLGEKGKLCRPAIVNIRQSRRNWFVLHNEPQSLADYQDNERAWYVSAAGAFSRRLGGGDGGGVGSGGREVEAMRLGVKRNRLGTHLGLDGLDDLELARLFLADHGDRAVTAVGAEDQVPLSTAHSNKGPEIMAGSSTDCADAPIDVTH